MADQQAAFSSLVGVRGAGKTTFAGLLMLTALEMSDRRRDMTVEVTEKTLELRTIVADLLDGMFPAPANIAENYQAEICLRFRRNFPTPKTTEVRLGLVDVGGETLREVMDRFAKQKFDLDEGTLAKIRDINQFILSANSFMLVVDLERMLLARTEARDRQDAQLARFVDALFQYKAHNTRSPAVKAVAVILSKYDRVEDLLSARDGISLRNASGRRAFAGKYMLMSGKALKNLPAGAVEMFFSAIQPELDANGEPTGKIRLDTSFNRPYYTADEYERMIMWINEKLG